MQLQFEWDDEKNKKNIAKHGISFMTAVLVFKDDDRVEIYDKAHSIEEDRYITIGRVDGSYLVLQVVYTERQEVIRIISARQATSTERKRYYDSKNNA